MSSCARTRRTSCVTSSDYCVRGDPDAGILALTYPRNTEQVAADPALLQRAPHRGPAPRRHDRTVRRGRAGGTLCRPVAGAHARDPRAGPGRRHHHRGGRRRDGSRAEGRRCGGAVLSAGPRRPRLLPDRRQRVDQCRRQPGAALRHGARSGAGRRGRAGRRHGHRRAATR